MSTLDELLAKAAAADGMTRIEFRDPIAKFREEAIDGLEPWLTDPTLGAFAVRTIEAAAVEPAGAARAREVLKAARGRCSESTRRDIDEALGHLRGRSTPTSVQTTRRAAPLVHPPDESLSSRGARRRLPVTIELLRKMTPSEVRAAVDGFSARYAKDWEAWLVANRNARPELLGRTLRKWRATRPLKMRRLKAEAIHQAPFLDDLLDAATEPLSALGNLTVMTVAQRSTQQDEALAALWGVFLRLTTTGLASCVGITKAVLLLTDGAIGPALDSTVREQVGVRGPANSVSCRDWLQILQCVGDDIDAFESANGPLARVVSPRFAHLANGRLYDMALGPR